MRLTDEELRDVIARAEEIQRVSRQGDEWNTELAAVIGAGEELGLSRTSIERALSERLDYPVAPPAIGSMVWAKSADGRAYVAEVLATSDDSVSVRFLRGSDHCSHPMRYAHARFCLANASWSTGPGGVHGNPR